MMPLELWIGLLEAEVTDACPHFGEANYAAVNAVAVAASEEEFVARVQAALEKLGLQCIGFEDVELYESRIAAHKIHKLVEVAAEQAINTGEVAFGTFHTTEDDSER